MVISSLFAQFVQKDVQVHIHGGLHQQMALHETSDKSWLSICIGEQTNSKLLSVNHCMRDEFQSIPPRPQGRNVFRSVFSLTAASDSALTESTNYFSAFYTELWKIERTAVTKFLSECTCDCSQQAGLYLSCRQLTIGNLPEEYEQPLQETSNCVSAKSVWVRWWRLK